MLRFPLGLAPLLLLSLVACAAPSSPAATPKVAAQATAATATVAYSVSSDWKTGFTGSVTITNTGPAIKGWTLEWTFPGAQVITNSWNGVLTQTGAQVKVTNASYNAAIPTGGQVTFGFTAKYPAGTANLAPGTLTFSGAATSTPAPTPPTPVPPGPVPPTPVPPTTGQPWVMGYYVGYLRDRYPLDAVKWDALTHLVVGRAVPNADGTVNTRFDIDSVAGPQWAKGVVARTHREGKKAILMLGGAGAYAAFVGAASDANRARFVTNLLQVVRDYGFDGIDLDWEPIKAKDAAPLKALAAELKAGQPGLILTLPVAWVNANFPGDARLISADLTAQFDRVNIMSYAMNGVWGGWQSWHSGALTGAAPTTPSSLESSVKAYLAAGVPAGKLGAGIGFFGSCYSGVTGPRQSAASMTLVADDNAMSYANIVTQYQGQMTAHWDSAAGVPYLSAASPTGPRGCTFVSYEDPQSIALKGQYVREQGLGGAIIWNINEGYIPSNPAGQRDPLMDAVKQAFLR
ncbi:cellulose binding domain-containing protein [Deinococcus sp. HMF7604]|uniref:glycosyl hydrolase family 18 protein n=1 Tax=Deinococcus betulae TaxID=2873312 RepID=UPI001CCEAF61|nr:glycosyl hydrolase family 18 protein [Deinococcus betulae]MBZ9749753.1 cellulose binding domain-containing protein [Deinococcus betulae]